MGFRLTSLTLLECPISPRGRIGVPRLPTGVPIIRDEGVPKLRGELRSISDVGTWVGGEEKRGTPGELAIRRRLGGGEMTSSAIVGCGGDVTSEVCRVSGGGPPAATGDIMTNTLLGEMSGCIVLTRSTSPSLS